MSKAPCAGTARPTCFLFRIACRLRVLEYCSIACYTVGVLHVLFIFAVPALSALVSRPRPVQKKFGQGKSYVHTLSQPSCTPGLTL